MLDMRGSCNLTCMLMQFLVNRECLDLEEGMWRAQCCAPSQVNDCRWITKPCEMEKKLVLCSRQGSRLKKKTDPSPSPEGLVFMTEKTGGGKTSATVNTKRIPLQISLLNWLELCLCNLIQCQRPSAWISQERRLCICCVHNRTTGYRYFSCFFFSTRNHLNYLRYAS